MRIRDLQPAMHAIPALIGIGLAVAGNYILPRYNINPRLGPIVGLPLGIVIGMVVLVLIAAAKKK